MVSERVKIINTHLSKLFSNIHNNLFNFLYYCNKLNKKIGKVATSNRCAMPSFSLTERLRLYRKVLWLMQAWSSSLELWNFFSSVGNFIQSRWKIMEITEKSFSAFIALWPGRFVSIFLKISSIFWEIMTLNDSYLSILMQSFLEVLKFTQ